MVSLAAKILSDVMGSLVGKTPLSCPSMIKFAENCPNYSWTHLFQLL